MTFNDFNLSKPLKNALSELGFDTPTRIQELVFPVIMSGRDVVGVAQTGTGKTMAYLLPLLRQYTFTTDKNPQILIIVPTRELVVQVEEEVKKLTTYINIRALGVYGGVNINTQREKVYTGMDLLIATPGRLYDLAMLGVIRFKSIKKLVIDEMDEVLALGFRPQLLNILEMLPAKRQNLLFSATTSGDIETFVNDYFYNPEKIVDVSMGTPLENIKQRVIEIPNHYTKVNMLKHMMDNYPEMSKVLLFVDGKKQADRLYELLEEVMGEDISIIHSNKAQNKRFSTVDAFSGGEIRWLVTTDILARGLDIADVTHVVNFNVPEQCENYIHRMGRTGRANKQGEVITFLSPREEQQLLDVEALMKAKIARESLPEMVEVSDKLLPEEKPGADMKRTLTVIPKETKAAAFHQKIAKNSHPKRDPNAPRKKKERKK